MKPGIRAEVVLKMNRAAVKGQVAGALRRGLDDAMTFDVVPTAKELSPIRTGTNRRSIDHETKSHGTEISAEVYTQSGYGGYLETGTARMSPRPYLRPAVERNRENIFKALEKAWP